MKRSLYVLALSALVMSSTIKCNIFVDALLIPCLIAAKGALIAAKGAIAVLKPCPNIRGIKKENAKKMPDDFDLSDVKFQSQSEIDGSTYFCSNDMGRIKVMQNELDFRDKKHFVLDDNGKAFEVGREPVGSDTIEVSQEKVRQSLKETLCPTGPHTSIDHYRILRINHPTVVTAAWYAAYTAAGWYLWKKTRDKKDSESVN